MAFTCGFFDSVDGDRKYSAEQMNNPYRRLVSNGVFAKSDGTQSDDFLVSLEDVKSVRVKIGEGIFFDKWGKLDEDMILSLFDPDLIYSRIDSVVVRIDKSNNARKGTIIMKQGTASSNPVAPILDNTEKVKEYRLANIKIEANAISTSQIEVTDTRPTTDCGFIISLVKQPDISTIYEEWEKKLVQWAGDIKDAMKVPVVVRCLSSIHTATASETTIDIGISDYNQITDILLVYINGMLCNSDDYSISSTTTITLTNAIDSGTVVTFVVLKSTINAYTTPISGFPKADTQILCMNEADSEVKALKMQTLVDYIKSSEFENVEYKTILDLIEADKFKDVYEVGSAINVEYTYGTTKKVMPMIVVENSRDFILADGSTLVHRPMFQPMYLNEKSMQFSPYRAFLACPQGLKAGSYKVTFAQTWSKLTTLEWYFTITHDVPVGGRLNAFHEFADNQNDLSVRTYDNLGVLLYTDTTVTSTPIDGATDLGTMNYTTRNGNLNCMQEAFYGWNDYEHSPISAYLDSDVTDWYTPSDPWDLRPSYADEAGWLSHFPTEFVKCLKTVQVKTAYNNVQGKSGQFMEGYHRAFLPSLEEMYIVNQGAGEGDVLPYWQERSGLDSPATWYTARDAYKIFRIDSESSSDYYWLRSCYRGYSYVEWIVFSSGFVSGYASRFSFRLFPLVVF